MRAMPSLRKRDYKNYIETRTGDEVLELLFLPLDDTQGTEYVLFYPRTSRGVNNALAVFQEFEIVVMEPPPLDEDLWDDEPKNEEVKMFRKQNASLTGIFYLWSMKKLHYNNSSWAHAQ